jgi:hypothetical protein
MAKKQSYNDWLKAEFGAVIDALELEDLQKRFLRSRWMDQVVWMEGRANKARTWYYILRLTAIIGGVMVPALVSLNLSGQTGVQVGWLVFVISLLVAISTAVESFFSYGERWRHYRQTVETLKSEGWQFFQLAGSYRRYNTYGAAYPRFATRVEEINQQDVQVYISQVVDEKEETSRESNEE